MAEEASTDLIERAKHDRTAFGDIYDLYLDRIYRFAIAHSMSQQDGEDLTALTFERALSAIGRYEQRGVPFSQWLYHITANLAIDRSRRMQAVMIRDDDVISSIRSTDKYTNPQHMVERWERANHLLNYVIQLPDEQQRAIQLRFFAEKSFAEIGEAMARSEPAAKQLVYRAIRQLRVTLQREVALDA